MEKVPILTGTGRNSFRSQNSKIWRHLRACLRQVSVSMLQRLSLLAINTEYDPSCTKHC